jgi:hypothetical protein
MMKRTLGPLETMRRREAVDFANASLRLEGFEPSAEALLRAEMFVVGEIELDQMLVNVRTTRSAYRAEK